MEREDSYGSKDGSIVPTQVLPLPSNDFNHLIYLSSLD